MGSVLSPSYYFPARDVLGYSDAYLAHALSFHLALGEDPFTCPVFQCTKLYFRLSDAPPGDFRFSQLFFRLGRLLFAFNAPKFNQWSHTQLQFFMRIAPDPLDPGLDLEGNGKPFQSTVFSAVPQQGGSFLFSCSARLSGVVIPFLVHPPLPGVKPVFFKHPHLYLWSVESKAWSSSLGDGMTGIDPLWGHLWSGLFNGRGKTLYRSSMMTPNLWTYI